jgi:hypothetical protein
VQALEVWDVVVDGRPLHGSEDLGRAVTGMVTQLRNGTAQRFLDVDLLPALAFDTVVLAGGGPVYDVARALRAAGIDADVAADPLWCAAKGGAALLEGAAVVDVGQTSIKRFGNLGTEKIMRPVGLTRASAVEWIAAALVGETRLVLALPADIDDDLVLGPCTYPWTPGDGAFVDDVLRAAGCDQADVLVLNDAELAALAVAPHHPGSTLVLTLGFGVGGALLGPTPSSSSSSPQ